MTILNLEDIKGKTIKSVDAACVNMWVITFTDGSVVRLGAEDRAVGPGVVFPCLELWSED